jgi:CRP/FNR family cyclic AMP-dependent transcriptional regulator
MLGTRDQSKVLINLFHTGNRSTYGKGEFVIRPGEIPPGVFYIESGLVKAYDITKYGEENLLIIRKSGDILGLTFAITGEDRNIIYQTLATTTAWIIPRPVFVAHLRSNPEAALPLVDMITDMYRLHSARILNLEYRTVRERLISFLLNTAQRFGKETKNGTLIDVPLRHQDIASSINSSRETTSREMAYLERKGLLENGQLLITIKDSEGLKKYL